MTGGLELVELVCRVVEDAVRAGRFEAPGAITLRSGEGRLALLAVDGEGGCRSPLFEAGFWSYPITVVAVDHRGRAMSEQVVQEHSGGEAVVNLPN